MLLAGGKYGLREVRSHTLLLSRVENSINDRDLRENFRLFCIQIYAGPKKSQIMLINDNPVSVFYTTTRHTVAQQAKFLTYIPTHYGSVQ